MIEKIIARLEEEIANAEQTMENITDNGGHTGDYCFASGRKVAYKEAIEIVQEVARDGGWIPCSEKEPCKDGYYFITTSDGEVDAREYDYGNGWGWDGFERVIAWRELPAPYKKGEQHEQIDSK